MQAVGEIEERLEDVELPLPLAKPVFGPDCGSGEWAGLIPDALILGNTRVSFQYSCQQHDICYGGIHSKAVCDEIFLDDMQDECIRKRKDLKNTEFTACVMYAQGYFEAVDRLGDFAYEGDATCQGRHCAAAKEETVTSDSN